ncbi:hypothetical protein BN1723_020037 [Verticillium longisporum]|uniref:Uncharacterized protein n=1 Tax=Verticillium longisporum TaxID=100787 RepID=A0A0G4NJ83_VERLO|nr:hypothetical protein BN1723_020037 [Verticillium longisporum]
MKYPKLRLGAKRMRKHGGRVNSCGMKTTSSALRLMPWRKNLMPGARKTPSAFNRYRARRRSSKR